MKRVTIKDLKSKIKTLEYERNSWREKFYSEEKKRLTLEAWIWKNSIGGWNC